MIIGEAYNQLVGYNWSEEEQALYEWNKKNDDDNVSCLKQSREEGKIEGKIEGKAEGKIEVAKNLLKAGVSIDTIAEFTGLAVSEIESCKKT